MINLAKRLHVAQDKAGFSISDLVAWFNAAHHSTMSSWLHGTHLPRPERIGLIEKDLVLLEKALNAKSFSGKFPVPLSISMSNRKKYILEVKADAIARFSSRNSAGTGNEVLGNDQ